MLRSTIRMLGEKVKIEVVTFGPGLHMLRDDTSPVKARIEEMMLSTPEVSFKACGNTQERMHKAENKDIPIVRSGGGGEIRRRACDGAAGEGMVLCETVSEVLDPEISLQCPQCSSMVPRCA